MLIDFAVSLVSCALCLYFICGIKAIKQIFKLLSMRNSYERICMITKAVQSGKKIRYGIEFEDYASKKQAEIITKLSDDCLPYDVGQQIEIAINSKGKILLSKDLHDISQNIVLYIVLALPCALFIAAFVFGLVSIPMIFLRG